MLDFLTIATRKTKNGLEVYPKFIIGKSSDLMIRGGDFYAIWVEDKGLWSTDEDDVKRLIDRELSKYLEDKGLIDNPDVRTRYMWDAESGVIDSWHRYCQKQLRDNFHMLDEKLIFANAETNKKDFSSKRLPYPLENGSIEAWEKLISTLYSPEERHKIEWAIGSIVSGESKKLQKFMVLYGAAGTGKSTIINVIEKLFEGYYSVFDAKALGSANSAFALEAFRSNPLVAIQHDGDLSKIEDNTRLNSLVSHEQMTVNEKFKATYTSKFKCFLFMATNRPVKITDAKSGLIRRLIDVTPSGNKLSRAEYNQAREQVNFELGAIAAHCQDVYLSDPGYYDDYVPLMMLGASNDFYNFVLESYPIFSQEDGTTLKAAWEMYKNYCDDAKVPYPLAQRAFKEELKNYFRDYDERINLEDGSRIRNRYTGFRTEKFEDQTMSAKLEPKPNPKQIYPPWLIFEEQGSILDKEWANCPAQYASSVNDQRPMKSWANVTTTLADLDTNQLHYVQNPNVHIFIDFDLKDENGNKSLERNIEAASKWPPTYAELSKSGCGIHLHYIYTGDTSQLSQRYDDNIEVKVRIGDNSCRRKLSKCNNLPIATISSGLPLKGEKKVVTSDVIKNEKHLRSLIKKNLAKGVHPSTKSSIDFINKLLNDAYDQGVKYDVTNMRQAILTFASNSSNNADYCIKLVNKMPFCSDEPSENVENHEAPLIFFDSEVFPNLFLVNWKHAGENEKVVRMINPTPQQIEDLIRFRLVGFNNRRYDNHMLYARLMGYSNEQLYKLSQRLIAGDRDAFFGEAYNLSYTDVYDFCSEKKSLKKWEIDLGIHHKELGLPWDQPVPEELWTLVAEYCDNDVIATEAVFNKRQADFSARRILAEISGLTVNDTTNTLSTRFIFGTNRNPQSQFNWRNMGDTSCGTSRIAVTPDNVLYDSFGDDHTVFDPKSRPIFPGYRYEFGVSTYRGEEVGEGGYVYAEPGIYGNVALLDIASMHPSSIIAEELFGPLYTARFKEIVDARIAIKHKDFEAAKKMLGGCLAKYLNDEATADALSGALKIVINSVYGLTSAKFDNAFRDKRNVDNIVAKRGALFMINLKHEVQKRGYTVAHIKTDSIKIPDATPEIIQFVMDYGKQYGYNFEHEDTYDRMCLVNDAVYIAKYKEAHIDKKTGEEIWWTATGTQFQVPYVFKSLFSKKDILFEDICEAKSVSTALYLDLNEDLPDVSAYEDELAKRKKLAAAPETARVKLNPSMVDISDDGIREEIAKGHCYKFVGKVGLFCPVKEGSGGGLLLREATSLDGDKNYASATGAKGYRWLESETVLDLELESKVDRSYYDALVNDAVAEIAKYGDFNWFVSEDPYVPADKAPWVSPCGSEKGCMNCEHCRHDNFHTDCDLNYDISDVILHETTQVA